ncbi:tRNA(Met) cytidine acetyltransferase TmcA [Marinobacter sp. DY40_1A1]|uniref:tRNA(Met) cytidine acetyltransferase TmcA n=1 Tax=Marinobacter sp. DY40_1A1 TaxID=2583229 RepID=UPI00190354FB|nr:GNAT family N-acetyltransferase [Marinobacter sp. DY40_1A1]MBK1886456.1 tRNA(Met) cytidine acetyltransferase [Marinobacter sp. DY40_1A1]
MSPETETFSPDLDAWRSLQAELAAAGQRRLVLVEGARDPATQWLQALLPALELEGGLWVGGAGDAPDSRLTSIESAKTRQWLGRETSVIVWDGWRGNPPDGFAALSGTLKAGGLLFWLMPSLEEWGHFADPDYSRTGLDHDESHPFAKRMAGILAKDSSVIRVQLGSPQVLVLPELPRVTSEFTVTTTPDQQELIRKLVAFGLGRRRRPMVVTADRGRGKSAALGMAAAQLLQQGRRNILVTAPSRDNVNSLFKHARETLGADVLEAGKDLIETVTGARLRFLPIRDLLREKPEAEVVMVDEAAAIPVPLLRRALLGWPRVAFASTVHGYEGAGRGFAIRFRQILDEKTPQWQSQTLSEPVRWADGDPLETLISDLFLLGAEHQPVELADTAANQVMIEPWQPARASEAELAEAFGLLVDAHYRTTPADLRQWLDDPAARSWRATVNGQTLGVLWGAVEGGLSNDLAALVASGRRRVRGHLLPQSLASHSGFPEAASQRGLRIIRIAVSAPARRFGLGSWLVDEAAKSAELEGLDFTGTSFGGNSDLYAFWASCGLEFARAGLQQEATSGEYSVQMVLAHSAGAATLVPQVRDRLARHWLTLVPLNWKDLEPELLLEITAGLPSGRRPDAADIRDLQNFSAGYRGFQLMLPVLRELSMVSGVSSWLRRHDEATLWCRAVLQNESWGELQREGLCSGQRDGEDRLRQVTRELLQKGPEL